MRYVSYYPCHNLRELICWEYMWRLTNPFLRERFDNETIVKLSVVRKLFSFGNLPLFGSLISSWGRAPPPPKKSLCYSPPQFPLLSWPHIAQERVSFANPSSHYSGWEISGLKRERRNDWKWSSTLDTSQSIEHHELAFFQWRCGDCRVPYRFNSKKERCRTCSERQLTWTCV